MHAVLLRAAMREQRANAPASNRGTTESRLIDLAHKLACGSFPQDLHSAILHRHLHMPLRVRQGTLLHRDSAVPHLQSTTGEGPHEDHCLGRLRYVNESPAAGRTISKSADIDVAFSICLHSPVRKPAESAAQPAGTLARTSASPRKAWSMPLPW